MRLGTGRAVVLFCLLVAFAFLSHEVIGDPTGATISNNATDTGPTTTPDNQTTARSTITEMNLDSTQQDQFWKAYVGNVTGTLSLDDANDNTIYDWSLATITGEVYATRAASLDLASFNCTVLSDLTTENTFHNMSAGQVDNVNATFNATAHQGFIVAGSSITANSCPSTALHFNDTEQTPSATARWQQVVIKDASSNVLYAGIINDDEDGFDFDSKDFQIIVPESNIKANPETYYFYLELGS